MSQTETPPRWHEVKDATDPEVAGRMSAAFWRMKRAPSWSQLYADSVARESRTPWADALLTVAAPGLSVLDLGCNCGVLTPLLTLACGEDVKVTGVDLNVGALEVAVARFPQHCWRWASAQDYLAACSDASFDLVVTGSCFSLIAPHEIDAVLAHVARVARVGAVFQEPISTADEPEGTTHSGCPEWRYNYTRRMLGQWASVQERHFPQYSEATRPCGVVVARKALAEPSLPSEEPAHE